MSHPIDVGSVLGGRYKVTATVLTSHDQDLVLDGVDQVLNRSVSILVAGPGNADQVAQSAREVATGERPGSVQVLDLGVSDATTYLITNHTSAADLLDLVVSSNPPYVEPFFTDTLGSEIFGQPRSHEPETYDGLYEEEDTDTGYINYGQHQRPAVQAPDAGLAVSPASTDHPAAPAAAGAATLAGAAGAGAAISSKGRSPQTTPRDATPQPTAPQPVQDGVPVSSGSQASAAEAPAAAPKVSLWSENDYDQPTPGNREISDDDHATAPATADHAPGFFPGSARDNGSPADNEDSKDQEPHREPRSMRWLVGGLLAAVLVVGLVLAVTNLGSLFKTTPQPAAGGPASTSAPDTAPAEPSGTASPAPAAGPPAVESVTRLGNFDFAGTYDGDLVKTFDGNAASYWSEMEFATDNWGGLATEVPLVVKLKGPSQVSSVTLSQLGASGGSISVYTNDRPSLEGARQVGSNSFTSPDLTMPLPEPTTAQYVIVSIKTLPKLAAPKTRYGYGLRLAEIKVQ
ncbi:ABC transporter substrate-binding protein [Micrococcaceae bacterium Sec5.8]